MQGNLSSPSVLHEQMTFPFPKETRLGHDSSSNSNPRHLNIRVEVLNQPILKPESANALRGLRGRSQDCYTRDLWDGLSEDPLEATEADKQQDIEWFCDHIEHLAEILIIGSLETLAGVGNAKEKSHAIEWMFAGDIYGHNVKVVGGCSVTRTIYSKDVPMTFQWCSRMSGLSAERLREAVLVALRVAEKETTFREQRGELKPGRHLVYKSARVLAETF